MEESLIGAIFVDPSVIHEVSDLLIGNDFYDDLLGKVFDVVVMLAEAQKHTDIRLVFARLRKYGITKEGVDEARVAKLVQKAVASSGARFYAAEILKHSNHRRLLQLVWKANSKLLAPSVDAKEVSRWLTTNVESIEARDAVDLSSLHSAAKDTVADYRKRLAKGGERAFGCSTGLRSLDKCLGGLCKGELIVLAARPGQGKTALAMQMANHASTESASVLFVSLEMTKQELASRVLCSIAGVDGRRLRSGEAGEAELNKLDEATEPLKGRDLAIYAPAKATLRHIRAAAKLSSMRKPLDLLVVDYLNIIDPEDKRQHRQEQIAEFTKGFKQLAKELRIPVLLLCQLNRQADGSEPQLSHLKESGAIEQDADAILAIHHEATDKPGVGVAVISVLKNRHGPIGRYRCNWSPAATRFSEKDSTEDMIPM